MGLVLSLVVATMVTAVVFAMLAFTVLVLAMLVMVFARFTACLVGRTDDLAQIQPQRLGNHAPAFTLGALRCNGFALGG